jgi:hypothetical protein
MCEPISLGRLEALYRTEFSSSTTLSRLITEMQRAGAGARGIVWFHRGTKVDGHFVNVVNHERAILFLDGLSGTWADFTGIVDGELQILRTN